MNSFAYAIGALTLVLPLMAEAQQRYTEEELIQMAAAKGVCGDLQPIGARYDTEEAGKVLISCGDAEGFVPAVAGLGLGGAGAAAGLVLVAVAGGSGGSTPSTNGTN